MFLFSALFRMTRNQPAPRLASFDDHEDEEEEDENKVEVDPLDDDDNDDKAMAACVCVLGICSSLVEALGTQ